MQPEGGEDILGPKKLNYQFLLLVRDKKYPEALVLGKKILETEPNNPAVKKFCDFISANNKQLNKMVEQQKQEQQYQSVDSDQEAEEQEDEGQQGGQKQGQNKQSSSEDEQDDKEDEEEQQQEQEPPKQQKPKPKVELTTCSLNQFPHICTRDHN